MMESLERLLHSICQNDGFCVSVGDIEESALVLIVGLTLSAFCMKEIYTRKLVGRDTPFYRLKDDTFDISLLIIYGILILSLICASVKWESDTLQVDVLVFNIVLATTALKLRDNTRGGILFTSLSYSSWYGLFRLFLSIPVGEDYSGLLRPQWLTSLFAFAAPALIANLKYPSLIQSSLTLVTYGSVIFGVLLAINASFVFFDLLVVHAQLFPGYGKRLAAGANFRLYGTQRSSVERIGYYLAMVLLQFVCVRIPHVMLDSDGLQGQLYAQMDAALQRHTESQRHKGKDFNKKAKNNPACNSTSTSSAQGEGKGEKENIDDASEALNNLPADCVEISPEDAILLQERASKRPTQPTAASTDTNTDPASASVPTCTGTAGAVGVIPVEGEGMAAGPKRRKR